MACLVLFVAITMPVSADPSSFRLLDWQPGDAVLNAAIARFFHLDLAKMPFLQNLPGGGMAIVNPGGTPAAVAYSPLPLAWSAETPDADTARAFTVRFQARGAGRASAAFVTERLEFTAGEAWTDHALTADLPGPVGPASLSFTSIGRDGRLEIRGVEIVRLPFRTVASALGDGVRIETTAAPPDGAQMEIDGRAAAFSAGEAVPPGPWAAQRGILEARRFATKLGVIHWRILDAAGSVLIAGGALRVAPPEDAPRTMGRVAIAPDGRLQVDGRPFFPLAIYGTGTPRHALATTRDAGLNVLILPASPELAAVVEEARRQGIEILAAGNVPPRPKDEARALVVPFRAHPVLGFAGVDEPDLNPAYAGGMGETYAAMRSAGAVPIYQSNHSPSKFATLGSEADILAPDPYPVSTVPRPLYTVAAWMDRARAVQPPGRSLWCIQQAFAEAPQWMRAPTPAELRASLWLALNHGARGNVFYAMHEILTPGAPNHEWDLRKSPLWEEIRRHSKDVHLLSTALLQGEGPIGLPARGPFDAALWRGATSLIAVVNVSDQEAAGRVFVGDERVATSGAWIEMKLPAYGVSLLRAGENR